ncbi:MAG: helix-turn-helix transcriptional regulator [Clostridium sp.]|jgi:DNA-binding phage protein|nr:helix-turn-helix transcriptional regulator [Clostridium sp.]
MTDLKLLKHIIDDSGMTMVAISQKTGILRETLYNRLNGKGEFTASEIVSLSKVLNLSSADRAEIFFGEKVE